MLNGKIKLYEAGSCKHREFVLFKGGSFKNIDIPAIVGFVKDEENILIDTGYGYSFFKNTNKFPQRLYSLITPVTLDNTIKEQIKKEKVDYIFITHFHADHIGGLEYFPKSKFLCSKKGYDAISNKNKNSLQKVLKGFLPKLLPLDFENRVIFIEDLPKINEEELSNSKFQNIFENGYKFLDKYYIFELKGHSEGQYGIVIEDCFFVGDSIWNIKTITEDKFPNIVSRLIMENYNDFKETVNKLKKLYYNDIKIIPTHCKTTFNKYKE